MSGASKVITYSGAGQAGVWNDAANWSGGVVPGVTDTALITMNATVNGPVEVYNLMLLGQETVAINGALKTDSLNTCNNFMVCENATATFDAGSSLNSAGGVVVGVNGVGTLNIAGASNGQAAAVVHAVAMKIGQRNGGDGTLNIGGVMSAAGGGAYIGDTGKGTVNLTGTGQLNDANLVLGVNPGAQGFLNLSGASNVNVSGYMSIGRSLDGAPGGTGAVTIGGTSKVFCDHAIWVNSGSTVALSGGTLQVGPDGPGLLVGQGATVSGNGTINSLTHGINDNGVIASSGGTLLLSGDVHGMGALQIDSGSTMSINASHISVGSISFLGTNDTLQLAAPVTGLTLSGFAAGDQIVIPGVDALSWNGASDVLTLSEHGQSVEHITLSGVAAGANFHLGQSNAGGVISMVQTTTTTNNFIPTHH